MASQSCSCQQFLVNYQLEAGYYLRVQLLFYHLYCLFKSPVVFAKYGSHFKDVISASTPCSCQSTSHTHLWGSLNQFPVCSQVYTAGGAASWEIPRSAAPLSTLLAAIRRLKAGKGAIQPWCCQLLHACKLRDWKIKGVNVWQKYYTLSNNS